MEATRETRLALFALVANNGLTFEQAKESLILGALDYCQGDKAKAAVVLGVSIRTIRNYLSRRAHGGADDGTPAPEA